MTARKEPGFIRLYDEPSPSVARPAVGGAQIYCHSINLYAESGGEYFAVEGDPVTISLAVPATIMIQATFTASVYTSVDVANGLNFEYDCHLGGIPLGALQESTKVAHMPPTALTSPEHWSQSVFPWTGVVTRPAGEFSVRPFFSITSDQINSVSVHAFVALIVGADTGHDCVGWGYPG